MGCGHSKDQSSSSPNSAEEINKVEQPKYIKSKLSKALPQFRACLEDLNSTKTCVIKFQIVHTKTRFIEIAGNDMNSEEKDCFKNVVQKLEFPLALDTNVQQPLSFSPSASQ